MEVIKIIREIVLGIVEEFKPIYINGERTKYEISNFGTIKSNHNGKTRIIKTFKNIKSGYVSACLYVNKKQHWRYVHRLVAYAFIPIPDKYLKSGLTPSDLEVNHICGRCKDVNTTYNLEWATSSDNKYHAYNTHLKEDGENCPASIYTDDKIKRVCALLEEGVLGNRDIWKQTGIPVATIQAILSKTQWKSISKNYDFSKRKKQHNLYDKETIELAKHLLKTTNKSYREIGDTIGMVAKSVRRIDKKFNIR